MSRVEIDLTNLGHNPEPIKVDGKAVNGVTALNLHMDYNGGDVPRLTLELVATDGFLVIDETEVEFKPRIITRDRPRAVDDQKESPDG